MLSETHEPVISSTRHQRRLNRPREASLCNVENTNNLLLSSASTPETESNENMEESGRILEILLSVFQNVFFFWGGGGG